MPIWIRLRLLASNHTLWITTIIGITIASILWVLWMLNQSSVTLRLLGSPTDQHQFNAHATPAFVTHAAALVAQTDADMQRSPTDPSSASNPVAQWTLDPALAQQIHTQLACAAPTWRHNPELSAIATTLVGVPMETFLPIIHQYQLQAISTIPLSQEFMNPATSVAFDATTCTLGDITPDRLLDPYHDLSITEYGLVVARGSDVYPPDVYLVVR